MINAKIIKIIAGCIASVSIIGGIYFAGNNREKANNTIVVENNERSIVKESKDEISSSEDNLQKEESETKNKSDENSDISKNIDSNNEHKENMSNPKTEINPNNDESLDNPQNEEIQNNQGTQNNEEVQNNNDMVLNIQDIIPEVNHNNGQGTGSNSNTNIPSTEEQQVSGSSSYIAEIEQLIFQKVNEERVSAGLSPLNYNSTMEHYARLKSKDMGDRGYFDHADPEGKYITEQMKADGVSYRAWGENIAYISGSSGNSALADRFMTNWMNSSGHRANILSTDFTSMGVGVYKIGNTYYATQEFYK